MQTRQGINLQKTRLAFFITANVNSTGVAALQNLITLKCQCLNGLL